MSDVPHKLVSLLRRSPDDRETAEVLADWCEEHGFDDVASRLRSPASHREYMQAVWTLSSLFGLESTIFNRYTFVLGLPVVVIPRDGADDETIVDVTAAVPFRLRRLILSPDNLALTRLQVGVERLLGGVDPVPAFVFGVEAFDTFDTYVNSNVTVCLHLINRGVAMVELSGCLLGDMLTYGREGP